MSDAAEFKIEWVPAEGSGRATVTVKSGDTVIFADTLSVSEAAARETFIRAVIERAPGVEARDIEAELLRIADALLHRRAASQDANAASEAVESNQSNTPSGNSSRTPGQTFAGRPQVREDRIPPELRGRPRGPAGAPNGLFRKGDAGFCLDRHNFCNILEVDEEHQRLLVHHESEDGKSRDVWHPFNGVIYAGNAADAARIAAAWKKNKRIANLGPPRPIPPWKPFPIDALPSPLREHAIARAETLNVEPAFVTCALLAIVAAAIGGARVLRIKENWFAPAILWVMFVVESGGMKSPVLKQVMRPLRDEEERLQSVYDEARRKYLREKDAHDKAKNHWKKDGKGRESRASKNESNPQGYLDDLPPLGPDAPTRERRIVEDSTVEALVPIFLASPRGLLLFRDEAMGLFDGLDEYKRRGGDMSRYNSMYDGGEITVDRKGGDPPLIYVRRALLSVLCGIQPGVLARRMSDDTMESGFLARFLLVAPPRTLIQWTHKEVPADLVRALRDLLRALFDLNMEVDARGKPAPVEISFDADALEVWIKYYDRHGREGFALCGAEAAWWTKIRGVTARLALILAVVRDPKTSVVTVPDVEAAIAISDWWSDEIDRVCALLTQGDQDRARKALVELIRRHGGRATPRDLIAWCKSIKKSATPAEAARAALRDLAEAGLGTIEATLSRKQGSPPKIVFTVGPAPAVPDPDADEDDQGADESSGDAGPDPAPPSSTTPPTSSDSSPNPPDPEDVADDEVAV